MLRATRLVCAGKGGVAECGLYAGKRSAFDVGESAASIVSNAVVIAF